MAARYPEHKELNFARIAADILDFWNTHQIFEKSVSAREGAPTFTFYEGPPSANGTPGIHHVMARTVKDIFCRYKTLAGYQVKRKGGWDTHGLPVELQVEKELGITKDDIGKTITIAEYNRKCRETVMKYKDQWDELTQKMGYWVDLQDPYVTFGNDYIETLWWLLKQLYDKKLLYKGYSIQPYSPAAGTGLSSHELNLPGCYRDVKDTSVIAQFKVVKNTRSEFLFEKYGETPVLILAWTTTPWTLPSNTALAVNPNIEYIGVKTRNRYTDEFGVAVIAKDRYSTYFEPISGSEFGKDSMLKPTSGKSIDAGQLDIPIKGSDLIGLKYEQLQPYLHPLYDADKAFRVVAGDFVTTEEGTGVVHTSPTFGADDFKVARQYGIPPLTVMDEGGNEVPVVDKKGRFVTEIGVKLADAVARYKIKTHRPLGPDDFYVKNYTDEDESHPDYKTTDVILSIILKEENKAFRVEKYEHPYPHCWRTDKPVLYYPLDSWFIRTTAMKDRMVELNKAINWKPESTGTGRFGNWLENLVDWNLSRSRFWGTPLPIWRTKDGKEEICIGSIEQWGQEIQKARAKGIKNPSFDPGSPDFDLHRPFVDEYVLVSSNGQPMYREPDLIDVWFDSGAMPFAQWHYPFENKSKIDSGSDYPADYIAEGVDQTRGWFFTLHAISVMVRDSVAFRNVISNGLVLDKSGNKMSKSKGNVVNPFETIDKYGPDVVRWYMIENAPPWDNLKFDMEGVAEVQRRFFGTLLNTYSFFALYANIDGFIKDEMNLELASNLQPIDRWILSKLQALIADVQSAYDQYEPTPATRAIQVFVNDHLSNWYVRLNRKRFWQPAAQGMSSDKKAAYETLFECLLTVSQLMSPVAPFFGDWLYKNLTDNIREKAKEKKTPLQHDSVHITQWAPQEPQRRHASLEQSMDYAQRICSLVHSIRKASKIKVRTPLRKVLLPVLDSDFANSVRSVEGIIMSEVNVKGVEYVDDASGLVVRKAKPNFQKLGKMYGSKLKEVGAIILGFDQSEIRILENSGVLDKGGYSFTPDDVLIAAENIPGWLMATDGTLTVALDIQVTDELRREGIARDFVNRIQNLRKDKGLDVLDKISIAVRSGNGPVDAALSEFSGYIRTETQAIRLELLDKLSNGDTIDMDEYRLEVKLSKL